jgi:hypothetical protein
MKVKIPKEITLKKFAAWIKENTRCEIRAVGSRVNVVVFADNIEAGRCVALYAESKRDQVLVSELCGDFYTAEEAWQALESGFASAYFLTPFHEWAASQYLTARDVRIEKLI